MKVHAAGKRYAAMAFAVALSIQGIVPAIAADTSADAGHLLAMARSERAAGHRMEALAYCQQVLQQWPNNHDAQALNVQLLSEMGASTRALELVSQWNPPADNTTRGKLRADAYAREIRWATGEPADPHHPYAEADKAINDTKALIADPATPDDIRQRARFDLLVALDQGDRADETLATYAPMQQSHIQLPAYAEVAVADALMQKHRPAEAITLYEDSIRRDPGPYDASVTDPRIALVFAYLDIGDSKKAFDLIDALAAREPKWMHVPDVRGAKQNPRKVDADSNAATARQNAGMPSEAYERLLALSIEAPENGELRHDLAMVELARGWPREAQDTLQIAGTLQERDVTMELDEAAVLHALNDYAGAQADIDQAVTQAERSGRVQDAQQAWDRTLGWQFDLTHDNGKGNSPDYGDRDQETVATLASPLIDDHWRVLAVARDASADLPEGTASRDNAGLGLEGFFRGIQFYAQALPSFDNYVHRTALEGGFTWAINDHWTLASDYSTAGVDIPLRAQYYGITGKTLNTSLQWRLNELTSARVVVNQDRFTDGNKRDGWLADVVQRLHTAPNFTFDGGVEIGGSHNSETDRPYFNPAQDRSYSLTGSIQNLLSQYYDRQLTERIDFSIGRYMERNFDAGWMASARYGQIFQPHNGLRFGWGLAWHNQPYDGKHESRIVLDVSMHWGE